eukprot:TRINITY_DN112971_c0_g1_i1.p1 TRINITY_DN112971_c0_g1~~TRINITY_DN112971_c0_g1_i1.p1  ORF type:complete len:174 (-),score=16.29 TRINITY_DN112971_c0_g1_i1:201-722(-)
MFNYCQVCADNEIVKWLLSTVRRPSQQQAQPPGRVRDAASFREPSAEQIADKIARWEPYIHSRSRQFFADASGLQTILQELARNTAVDQDLVLDDEGFCVHWYGDVVEDGVPALTLAKPNESTPSPCYVNRLVAFIFADDESFHQLLQLPKEPFLMSCGDQLCCHIKHIRRDA